MNVCYNLLTNDLPDSVKINDVIYPVKTSFKDILNIVLLLNDENFTERERLMTTLSFFFYQNIPDDLEKAKTEMNRFISCYRQETLEEDETTKQILDYEYDNRLIFSAFYQLYHIDISETDMHWFKFSALLENLNAGTPLLVNVIGFRSYEPKKDDSPQTVSYNLARKEKWALPNSEENYYVPSFDDQIANLISKVGKHHE